MKIQSIFALGLIAILSSAIITANAQSQNEPAIKILQTSQKGILKVLYAYGNDHSNQSVKVKFFNNDEVIKSDEIKQGTFENGFLKKYDTHLMSPNNFWIEVSAANVSVIYKLSNDGSFAPILEKTTFNYDRQVVAINN